MTFYNRGGFGGGRDQNYGRGERQELFDAVCANCGSNCKVPFRPSGRKEVLCSKCFENAGGGSRSTERNFRDSNGPRRFERSENRGGFSSFKRDEDRSFSRQSNSESRSVADSAAVLESISTKLDKIISLLSVKGKQNDAGETEVAKEMTRSILEKIHEGGEVSKPTKTKKSKSGVSKKE